MLRKCIFFLLLFFAILSGCTMKVNNHEDYTDFKPLDVRIHLPDTIGEGASQTIYASVSQGDEVVSDAELVRFEVWSNSHKQHEWVIATYEDNGLYAANINLTEEGLYYVKVLTQVDDLFALPTKRFAVGKLSEEEALILIEGNQLNKSIDHSHH